MEIHRLHIPKQLLDRNLTEDQRTFLILGAHIANELRFLHRLLLFAIPQEGVRGPEEQAQTHQAFFITKLFAAKLYAAWEVINDDSTFKESNKEGRLVHPIGNELSTKAKDALEKIRGYFGKKDSLIELVRQENAAHYDDSGIRTHYRDLSEQEEWFMYLSEQHLNSIYHFAEMAVGTATLRRVGRSLQLGLQDEHLEQSALDAKSMEAIIGDVQEVAGYFVEFLEGCILVYVSKYLHDLKGQQTEALTVHSTVVLRQGLIPFFCHAQ